LKYISNISSILGAVAITAAAFLVHVIAGLVVMGVFLIIISWFTRDSGDHEWSE
jgi:hypothetical protein